MSLQAYRSFARKLVQTGELDPLYTLAYRARELKGDAWVQRFCMTFLMFYDSNVAAEFADEEFFWERINTDYQHIPRGRERRHFRGEAGRRSIQSLQALGSPESAFQIVGQGSTLTALRDTLGSRSVFGFGPYFQIKWADLLDSVMQYRIDYSELPKVLPDSPIKCIKQVFPDLTIKQGLDEITSWVADLDDPFSGYRKCGYSEAETIACAIPSYLIKKHYKMGDDIQRYKDQLKGRPELKGLLP